jgi:hypothetical protein
MSKVVAITAAVLLSTAVASPALAKKHHHAHAAPAVQEQQVLFPSPLIGGQPIRTGNSCYTVRSADWGAGFASACPTTR